MPSGAFEPPPTYAEVVLIDSVTKKHVFNPIWLKWFIDLAGILSVTGGGGGTILHNNLGSLQGGAANEYYHLTAAEQARVAATLSGTYTPTLTNTTNLAASTAYQCQYLRVNNTVTVSGRVDIDPTALGQIVLGISLPVPSNFGAVEDCGGVGAPYSSATRAFGIYADVANDRATMEAIVADIANFGVYFTFTYQVI